MIEKSAKSSIKEYKRTENLHRWAQLAPSLLGSSTDHRRISYDKVKSLYGSLQWYLINDIGLGRINEVISIDHHVSTVGEHFLYSFTRDEIVILSSEYMQVMEKTLVLPSTVRIRTMMREYRRDLFPISLHKTWEASMIWFLTDDSEWTGQMLCRLTEKVVLT